MNDPQDPIIVGVHRCVREAFHIAGEITPEMESLIYICTSYLERIEFVLALEDEFHIDIPDEVKFKTVQSAVDYVRHAVGERA